MTSSGDIAQVDTKLDIGKLNRIPAVPNFKDYLKLFGGKSLEAAQKELNKEKPKPIEVKLSVFKESNLAELRMLKPIESTEFINENTMVVSFFDGGHNIHRLEELYKNVNIEDGKLIIEFVQ